MFGVESRSCGERFQPKREMGLYEYMLSAKSERGEVQFLPSAPFFNDSPLIFRNAQYEIPVRGRNQQGERVQIQQSEK